MFKNATSRPSRPASSSSLSVSTSEVSREITRPEVNRSWKDTDSACAWSNPRRRRSNRMAWPMTPLRITNTERSQPDSSAATASTTLTTVSDV